MSTSQIIFSTPENVSIVVYVNLQTMLVDKRPTHFGQLIGTIEDVANQYGIKKQIQNHTTIFTAPKSRIQLMVEKLHFAGVSYDVL